MGNRVLTDHAACAQQPEVGLLLVGHGSRNAAGVAEFLAAGQLVARSAQPWAVEPCFLEFAQPSIAEGFARLAARNVNRIVVAPAILFAAAHLRSDIPREVALAAKAFPHVAVVHAEHLGCHRLLVELSKRRYDAALAGQSQNVPPDGTVLVMVGRGSRDAAAIDETRRFTRMRHEATPVRDARTAFLAMATPSLADTLDEVARGPATRIVVQPHLLFAGELLGRTRSVVEQYAQRSPRAQWLVVEHLGPSELIAAAILDRASTALHAASAQP